MAMRKPFYLRYVDATDGDKDKTNGGSDKTMEHGFPKDTPLVEMDEKQQLAYWKYHARRHEGVANSRSDYDQQKADAEKWRKAEQDNKPADQKSIDDAAERARQEERNKLAPRLVAAEFKSLGSDIPKDLLQAFLEDLNHTNYLKPDGDVDATKVQDRVDSIKKNLPAPQQQQRQNHQGHRRNDGATSITNGRDLFESRLKKK